MATFFRLMEKNKIILGVDTTLKINDIKVKIKARITRDHVGT